MRASRDDLARARTTASGRCAAAAALHALEGDGVGRVRPRDQERRALRLDGPVERWRELRDADPRRGLQQRRSIPSSAASSRRTAALARREPAADAARRLPARRRSARARHGRGDRAPTARRRLRAALRLGRTATTACRRARARSSPAASGSPTTRAARPARRGASGCSSGCWRCATTSGCSPRSTTSRRKRLVGNFPQAFSHIALVNTAHNLARREKPAEQRAEQKPVKSG